MQNHILKTYLTVQKDKIRKAKNFSNFSVNIKECFKYFYMIFDKEIEKEESLIKKYLKLKQKKFSKYQIH